LPFWTAMTDTGMHRPSSVKICVMPALLPKTPTPASRRASTLRADAPAARATPARTGVAREAPIKPEEAEALRPLAPTLRFAHAGATAANWKEAIAAIFAERLRRAGRG